MKPIHLKEIDGKDRNATHPGNGVGPEYHPDILGQRYHQLNPNHSENTPAAHHYEHGHPAESRTTKDACHTMGISYQRISKNYVSGHQNAIADDLRIIVEKADQIRCGEVNKGAAQF